MVHRALRAGIEADYLLADAWFGTKPMIKLCQETFLVPVFRMKKGTMKYHLTEYVGGEMVKRGWILKPCIKTTSAKPGRKFQGRVIKPRSSIM